MKKLRKLGLQGKIVIFVIVIGIVCTTLIATISSIRLKTTITKQVSSQLQTSLIIMESKVAEYFRSLETFTNRLAKDRLVEGLFIAFEGSYYGGAFADEQDNVILTKSYLTNDKIYGKRIRKMAKDYGMKNIFLAINAGTIAMTSTIDNDGTFLGRNLKSGSLKNTPLAKCYQQALDSKKNEVFFAPYALYGKNNIASSFFCKRMTAEFDHDDDGISKGDVLGVIITEVDINKINEITSQLEGMGETGQFYVVGDDFKLRTNLRLEPQKFNVNNSFKNNVLIKSPYIKQALAKHSRIGGFTIGPNGHEVLAYYIPLEFDKVHWVFVAEKSTKEILTPLYSMISFITIATLLVIAGIFSITFIIAKKLSDPILSSTQALKQVSSDVFTNAKEVKEVSTELNSSSSTLSSSVHQTVATLDQLGQMVNRNMDNVEKSSASSEESKSAAEAGMTTIQNLMNAFEEISDSNDMIVQDMHTTTDQMSEISTIINDIAQKTSIINDIVFQTKLLAFNASVEAARAGEHGKGFAVVAEEVGNLAQASGEAAKEIATLVAESVEKVTKIVGDTTSRIEVSTTNGKQKVELGHQIAQECNENLATILENVNAVNEAISDVKIASEEQNMGIQEVSTAMRNLDEVIRDMDKLSGNLLETSNSMNNHSTNLSKIVTELNELLNNKKA